MIDKKALFNIGYGLYVVTTNDGKKDNGLILNSVMQSSNDTISVSINKENYSCNTVLNTGKLNVCPIDITSKFSLFQHFGFQSGRDVNKFEGYEARRSGNGLIILEEANSYISLEVKYPIDCGSHILFICNIVESEVLKNVETMSYSYYHKNVKPKKETKTKGYVCGICGYVYEGDIIPDDYVCPLCLHGKEYFEEIK